MQTWPAAFVLPVTETAYQIRLGTTECSQGLAPRLRLPPLRGFRMANLLPALGDVVPYQPRQQGTSGLFMKNIIRSSTGRFSFSARS